MDFNKIILEQITILENRPDHKSDIAFRRIVEILKQTKTPEDLARQKNLINRIAVDSVENLETINIIDSFLNNYSV